ncbi:hypothetical protein COCON_G00018680 [Conger conger]|uniref:Uncharacterized protein n=1 Tax=Conger conger TaxID=82655 RepID=A0A9Q1E4H6_CONCO|nr:hypothetical protein COCON_G00018680 [Conger conger]
MPRRKNDKPKEENQLRRSIRLITKPAAPVTKKVAVKKLAKAKKPKPAPVENSDGKADQAQKAEAPADTK